MSEQAAEEKSESEQKVLRELFMQQLDVDEDVAPCEHRWVLHRANNPEWSVGRDQAL